jgi:hypothetical protein
MKPVFRKHVAAAMMLLAPLGAAVLVAQPAAAQNYQYRVAEPEQGRITSMTLNSDGGLRPGATLRVQVAASPEARWANVQLGNSGVRIPLREVSPGEYVGTHVIRRGERIDPTQLMTARAGWGEGPVQLAFNFPPSFQALAMGAAPAPASVVVNSFTMTPTEELEPGQVVRFRLEGTPRARAFVTIPDVAQSVPLREVRPGVYVGSYTIRRSDDTDSFDEARAVLRSGNQRVEVNANESQHLGYGYGR